MTPLIRECVGLFPNAEELMWFDVGAFGPACPPDGNLPFEKCAVVGVTAAGNRILMVCAQNESALSAFAYGLFPNDYIRSPQVTFARVHTDDKWQLLRGEPSANDTTAEHEAGIAAVIAVLGDFMQRTATVGYRPTVKRNSILNQQRARKGKPPLQYDWHTVTIQPPQIKSEPKGGTHASPRLHDRRGHFRKLKSGARVWVNPCKVGDASKGTVFKDYKVAS